MKNLPNKKYSLQSKDIAKGSLRQVFPELYELSGVYEINPWHDHQSVFDHTIGVVASLEKILLFGFLFKDYTNKLLEYLNRERHGYSRRDVAVLVALMHDVGKKETCIQNAQTGQTSCPEHEKVGGKKINKYLGRMSVVGKIVLQIRDIVSQHGIIHEAVNRVLLKNEPEKEFIRFRKKVSESYILYLLQGYADTAGSDLSSLNPKEYKKREIIYQEAINRFAASL